MKKLVFVTLSDCEPCKEFSDDLDPSIPQIDLMDLIEKNGFEKLCPDLENCPIPQLALIDESSNTIVAAFHLEDSEEIVRLLIESEDKK